MTDLPVLKPIEPVAVCGLCNNKIYPDWTCQAAGPRPSACPINGEQVQMWRRMDAMRNAYIGPLPLKTALRPGE